MKDKVDDLIAFCGYYCADCMLFNSRIAKLAEQLGDEIDRSGFDRYFAVKSACADPLIEDVESFNDYQVFKKMLDVLVRQTCHTPCRSGGDGCGEECPIKRCVLERGLQGCWECGDYESCDKTDFVVPFWGDILRQNIELIKTHGLETWLEYRPAGYIWLK
mgnify:CR=1 FL=1